MGTLTVGTECNTLTRTPGKSSNILLGWPFKLGEIDGSHSMKKNTKSAMEGGRRQDHKTQRSRHVEWIY